MPKLLIIYLLLAAQTQDDSTLGTISGRVIDSLDNQPIPRAKLTLKSVKAGLPATSITDEKGGFTIHDIDPGSYTLEAVKPGYLSQIYATNSNTPITISAGDSAKDFDFKLTPQSVLSGRVLDEEGDPLVDVEVVALRSASVSSQSQRLVKSIALTNDMGEFRLANLPSGRYFLLAAESNHAFILQEPRPRNASGKPTLMLVPTYFPSVTIEESASPINLASGQIVSALKIEVKMAKPVRLRGTISSASEIPQGLSVAIVQKQGSSYTSRALNAVAKVKPDASFDFDAVVPGSYILLVNFSNERTSWFGRLPVEATNESIDDLKLPLVEGLEIHGIVQLDPAIQEAPPSFESIYLDFKASSGRAIRGAESKVNSDGTFVIKGINPVHSHLRLHNLPAGLWLKSIRAGSRDLLDTGFEFESGSPGPIVIILGSGLGSISGEVSDSDRVPASGATVTLFPDPLKSHRQDLYRITTADHKGQFKIEGIAPGNYKLYAWKHFDPATHNDSELLMPFESQATRIAIKAATTENQILTLIEQP